MSSSQPLICVPTQIEGVFRRTHRVTAELSKLSLPKQYSQNSIPPRFPNKSGNAKVHILCHVRVPRMKRWGFEANRAIKFTRVSAFFFRG